jgi:kynurenine 3-monooxygenase
MRSLPRFWAPGGVVLVGDAAHTVTPALGQGLNSALQDCELLAEELRCRGAGPAVGR